jgi:very-long-chain enoyl-CoA reductase
MIGRGVFLTDYSGVEITLSKWILLGVWGFAELSNLKTHLILMNLRPVGSTVRKVPVGYGFNLVTCPNYFFEILGWVAYSLIVQSVWAWVFTVVGAVQMYFWAVKKHQRYKQEFGKEYVTKRVLIPFLI